MADKLLAAGARFTWPTPTGAVELLGHSASITRVHELIRRAAPQDVGVLLTAERGADVDSVACELHGRSRRAAANYIGVECDGVDASRLAQHLFGTAPPVAPTDLESISRGSRIAAARGGTLFLQDVTELPVAVQARLARILRDKEVLVEGQPTIIDVRFIASALQAVGAEVNARRLRSDLFRRLAAVRIDLPPLRDRLEDVPVIATRVLEEVLAERGVRPRAFTHAALALLAMVTWPGNLCELRAAIVRAIAEPGDQDIQVEHLLPALCLQRTPAPFVPAGNLREARLRFERDYISSVLQHHAWRMSDAAHTLGIQRPNLYRKARQLGIPVTRLPSRA